MSVHDVERALSIAALRWKDENLADRTIGNYSRSVRRIAREADLFGPGAQASLERWRERQQKRLREGEISASHVSCDRSALVALYEALKAKGKVKDNPAQGLAGVPAAGGKPRPIPVDDQVRMLRLPDLRTLSGLRDRAVLECLRHGMRQAEVIGLKLSGVSYDARQQSLFLDFRAKGRKKKKRTRDLPLGKGSAVIVVWYLMERFAPFAPTFNRKWDYKRTMAALEKLLAKARGRDDVVFRTDTDRALYQEWMNRMFNHYRDAAGVDKRFTVHTFRHRFGTSLLEAGVDLLTRMRLMGHEDVRSTMIYTEVERTQAVAGIGAFDATPGVTV